MPDVSGAGWLRCDVSFVMADIVHSQFVREVADEFSQCYQQAAVADESAGEFWFECRGDTPSRLGAPLSFGINDGSITVAFEGLVVPIQIRPPFKDALTARTEGFALFDDLITDRKVAISFWLGKECVGVEFIPAGEIQSRQRSWRQDFPVRVRVRSFLGEYDYDSETLARS